MIWPDPLRRRQISTALGLAAVLVVALWAGLDLQATHPALAALVLALFAVNAVWLAGTAITAIIGAALPAADMTPRASVRPGPCAILWLVCGEDPAPVATRIRAMAKALHRTGQDRDCRIFVLSDTAGAVAQARERAAMVQLGTLVHYRHRNPATGRKPGNLRDWLAGHGAAFDTMLVLDADSGFSADRLARMRAQMAAEPQLGLIQAAIRLRPGSSRFAALQRLSGRLCGPVFARGLARLSAESGNYWGHNALIRTAAFDEVAHLPELRGRPPLGGAILSHDFVEAAFLRRAGWQLRIDPDSRGSFEDAPESIAAHLRRDRRWAQGNLQHVRVIGEPGLHPASRLHLLAGIQSYLSAPIWLALVLLFGSGAVHATGSVIWPLAGTLALLMVPKLAGVLARRATVRGRAREAVLWRAFRAELFLSTLYAPLGMVRRTAFVLAVLAGRDSGWVPSGSGAGRAAASGWVEAAAGLAILSAVAVPQALINAGGSSAAAGAALLVLPIVLPLLAAPWLVAWFDADAPARSRDRIAAYYDASTRRFLAVGGSGAALAIHRPLWAPGVGSPDQAAAHVNTLVARAAEAALGRPPDRVRDLGCGVGGTLFHLAGHWPQAALSGLTLSAEQVRLARSHARARGLDRRVHVLRSDFTLPTTLPRADLVLAIESHVHAPSAASFLQSARAHLAPGGVLIVVDDMLAVPEDRLDPRARSLVAAFRRGWRLGHVTPACGLLAAAREVGLQAVSSTDLGPLLRLDRWRDRALRLFGPLADRLGLGQIPLFSNMIGGNALTQAHRGGIMAYRMVVLQSAGGAASDTDTIPQAQGKSAA